jgi:hypothetical protein
MVFKLHKERHMSLYVLLYVLSEKQLVSKDCFKQHEASSNAGFLFGLFFDHEKGGDMFF